MMGAPKPTLGYPSRTEAVAALRAQGMVAGEIASRIGIKPETVTALESSARRTRREPTPGRRERQSSGRVLSEQQLAKMCELRERGWSLLRIANYFEARGTKVHQSTIGWQCLRLGADLPPERRKPNYRPRPAMRNGHLVRPFTAEEDAKLLDLERGGATMREMCEALGRKNNSIRGRLMILARAEARAEESA